jgi:hypothetical protein
VELAVADPEALATPVVVTLVTADGAALAK